MSRKRCKRPTSAPSAPRLQTEWPNFARRAGGEAYAFNMVFRPHRDLTPDLERRWQVLLGACANDPQPVIKEWVGFLQAVRTSAANGDGTPTGATPRAGDVAILACLEGGIGCADTRQIRIDPFLWSRERSKSRNMWVPPWYYNEITLCATASKDDKDGWDPQQLLVFFDAFSQVISGHLGTDVHNRRIEVVV